MGQRWILSRLFYSCYRRREPNLGLVSYSLRYYLLGNSRQFFGSERHHAHIRPPVAPKTPFLKEAHGIDWNDSYHWMSTPAGKAQLTEHLHRENRYADAVIADTLPLQRRLVQEMEGRMSTELSIPPERWGSWYSLSACLLLLRSYTSFYLVSSIIYCATKIAWHTVNELFLVKSCTLFDLRITIKAREKKLLS